MSMFDLKHPNYDLKGEMDEDAAEILVLMADKMKKVKKVKSEGTTKAEFDLAKHLKKEVAFMRNFMETTMPNGPKFDKWNDAVEATEIIMKGNNYVKGAADFVPAIIHRPRNLPKGDSVSLQVYHS